MRRSLSMLRWIFGIALLGAVLLSADVHALSASLGQLTLRWGFVLLLPTISLLIIGALKWQCCTAALGQRLPFRPLFLWYLSGYAVNFAIPSFVGGDVLRGWYLARRVGLGPAVVATVLDRYLTLLVVVILALAGMRYAHGVTPQARIGITALAGALLLLSGGALFASDEQPSPAPGLGARARRFLGAVRSSLAEALRRPAPLARAFALAVLYQCVTVLNVYTAACAIGWTSLSLADLAVTVPVIFTLAGLPLSPAALGLQEAAFVYFLAALGGSPGQTLGVAVIMRAKSFLLALAGCAAISTAPTAADCRTNP